MLFRSPTQHRRCRPAVSNIEGREFHSRAQGWNLAVFLVMQTLLHLAMLHLRVREDPLHIVYHRGRNLGLIQLGNQLLCWMLDDFRIENRIKLIPIVDSVLQLDRSEEHTSELQSLMRISY